MAQPKCPDCGITGIEHITCEESTVQSKGGDPWFEVAFCDACGHVYGVFAKIVKGPTPPSFEMPMRTVDLT
ncbi:transcriptional regulator [Pseudomonas mosselii]|uniref:transcriptional regulator n=1 Tax=Pseudomonas mosselii TaxID=78327 RepID=UPI0027DEA850|nr:transcriptional regulator [Pseudomonas mosselii]